MKFLPGYSLFLLIICSAFLASCHLGLRDEFSKQKYTNFPKAKVSHNKTENTDFKPPEQELVVNPVTNNSFKQVASVDAGPVFSPEVMVNVQLEDVSQHTKRVYRAISESNFSFNNFQYCEKTGRFKMIRKGSTAGADSNTVVLILLCIFLPPLAVYMKENSITSNFWIDLILTLLFWLPGVIYAFIICFA